MAAAKQSMPAVTSTKPADRFDLPPAEQYDETKGRTARGRRQPLRRDGVGP